MKNYALAFGGVKVTAAFNAATQTFLGLGLVTDLSPLHLAYMTHIPRTESRSMRAGKR